tara:strand:- start:422 stop:1111 length:690 start_codon:yes stop_codon:yes gene_type:complete
MYDTVSDLNHNNAVIERFGNLSAAQRVLKINGHDWTDTNLSWHYHFFSSLLSNSKDLKILEIGTFDGNFARFLAEQFDVNITTIDLPRDSEMFRGTYGRDQHQEWIKFCELRDKNLLHPKITFIEMDSFQLPTIDQTFDVVWVDGDHMNPQVTIDIYNALLLTGNDGLVLVDDFIDEPMRTELVSNDGALCIRSLEERGLVNLNLMFKRVQKLNADKKHRKRIAILSKN